MGKSVIWFDIIALGNEQNIRKILLRASEAGVKFYKHYSDPYMDKKPIGIRAAVNRYIIKNYIDQDLDRIELKTTNNLITNLLLVRHQRSLSVGFTNLGHVNNEPIEQFISQFVQLLLYMTQDFQLQAITLEPKHIGFEFKPDKNIFKIWAEEYFTDEGIKKFIENILNTGTKLYDENNIELSREQLYKNIHPKPDNITLYEIKIANKEESGMMEIYLSGCSNKNLPTKEKQETIFPNSLVIELQDLTLCWTKKFNGKKYLDIARYTQLLLDFVKDFPLYELKVGKN